MKKITISLITLLISQLHATIPVVINPAGDAKHLGRKLDEGYERAATLRFAEKLQQQLAQNNEKLNVIVSRRAGEEVSQQEIASFVNRLQAKLSITIHVYKSAQAKPNIHLYHLCYNPFTELTAQKQTAPDFTPLHKTHRINMQATRRYLEKIGHTLKQKRYKKKFDVNPGLPAPLKELVGIVPPAISIEIGINKEKRLDDLVGPVAHALQKVLINNNL